MKMPRDVGGDELISRLESIGYSVTRQTGSHVRMTHKTDSQTVHLTVPRHSSLRVGTLNAIMRDAATQLEVDKETLVDQLFAKR